MKLTKLIWPFRPSENFLHWILYWFILMAGFIVAVNLIV